MYSSTKFNVIIHTLCSIKHSDGEYANLSHKTSKTSRWKNDMLSSIEELTMLDGHRVFCMTAFNIQIVFPSRRSHLVNLSKSFHGGFNHLQEVFVSQHPEEIDVSRWVVYHVSEQSNGPRSCDGNSM